MDEKALLQAIREIVKEEVSPIKEKVDRLEVLMEHDIPKQINLLAEGHANILERLPEAEEIDSLRSRVRTLERVITNHTEEINRLKQAN